MRNPTLVNYFSPAAYSIYLFHYPTWEYLLLFKLAVLKVPVERAQGWYDYFIVVAVTTVVAVFASHKLNAPLTSLFLRGFDGICWFCSCCGHCSSRTCGEDEGSTLEKVAVAIHGLSGADVDERTRIADCGLDSFGTGALIGLLRPRFKGLRITPLQVYRLQTVGELVARIDSDVQRHQARTVVSLELDASHGDNVRTPLTVA